MIKLSKEEKKYLKIGVFSLISIFAIRSALKYFNIGGGAPLLDPDNTGLINQYLTTTTTPATSSIFLVSAGTIGRPLRSAEKITGYVEADSDSFSMDIPAGDYIGILMNVLADFSQIYTKDITYYIPNSSKVKYAS